MCYIYTIINASMINVYLDQVKPNGAFAIGNFKNGSFIVPGWIPVPVGTLCSDVNVIKRDGTPVPKMIHIEPKPKAVITYKTVPGSNGSSYEIKLENGTPKTCTCAGFSFRKTCKHLLTL